MKKSVLPGILIILLIFSLSFAIAAANATDVDKAYKCLEGKVKDKCASLSGSEERVFSLLAIGQCKENVLSDSKYMSDTKFTAQAILALARAGTNTADADTWLISQNKTTDTINWFLQIDSDGNTCTVSYADSSNGVTINTDKTLTPSGSGTCLSVDAEGYRLLIEPSCYNQEFVISCGTSSFLTDLLYKKTTDSDSPLYVSANTHSSTAGTTKEKVSSFCFPLTEGGSSCDYEATLWAALVLKSKGNDVSSYLPYLVTMADETDNKEFIPESFLYTLTNTLRAELLAKQYLEGYWKESDNQYYDTAVAALPFSGQDLNEKTKAKNWLQTVQGTDGCWNNGNILDTAFLLYSLWPRAIGVVTDEDDCVSSGFFCMSAMSCIDAGGDKLEDYSGCYGVGSVCCSKEQEVQTCSEQGGDLCTFAEQCLGGNIVEASDSDNDKSCCVGGTCGIQEVSECETNLGSCKSSCSDQEQSSSYSCTSSYDLCCVAKKSSNLWWIILLLAVLIILVALGIIFRKQLKDFFFNLKSKMKFGKGKEGPAVTAGGPPRFFPSTPSTGVYPGAVQRRIIPQTTQVTKKVTSAPGAGRTVTTTTTKKVVQPVRKAPSKKGDFDDILKKLKEIGK